MCAQVTFRDPYRYKHQKALFVAAEGLYTGQVRACECCLHPVFVCKQSPETFVLSSRALGTFVLQADWLARACSSVRVLRQEGEPGGWQRQAPGLHA